ncbi:DUF1775 domain-containing protein [Kitasatospora sp. NPDC057692]|uniref:DUF1775 domain-containing protein n=1 Tax=Kitasatospora sp. NPDC057692 TaxID=3346215 RepID=UPI00368E1EB5
MSVSRSRAVARAATAVASAAIAVALGATAAFAHVEVASDQARALAVNVTVTFTGEAESGTSGFAKVQVVLPEGITPGDVALVDSPAGWAFSATADGYAVGGPALAVGQDVVHRITIRQLPDTDEVVFKTLETYSDGRVDRWIELPQNGVEPEHPAPVLKLAPASPGATALSASTAAEGVTAPGVSPSVSPASAGGGGGSSPALPIAVGGVVVLAVAAGGWWWRRGRGRGSAG